MKLIALDGDDLKVVSAHLQDAVLKVGDMAFVPRERRFAAILNRFDWTSVPPAGNAKAPTRRQTALRFERVLGAKVTGIDLKAGHEVLALLALQFEPTSEEDPQGYLTLVFAGGGAVRLHVECIEAEMKDLGPAWQARQIPQHPDDDTAT